MNPIHGKHSLANYLMRQPDSKLQGHHYPMLLILHVLYPIMLCDIVAN